LKPINTTNRDELYEIGIADSLIHRLGSMKGFVVRPLSATRKYADINQDPIAAGREQQVDYILASNYQLAGGRIRVTSQLFNVASGQIEETYKSEKDAGDIFAMQDAIAGEVGNLLLARFATTLSNPTTKSGTNNEEAYRLYLQGIYLSNNRNLTDARKAVEVLEQAVQLDPNYAQAWAGKAYAHRVVANFTGRSINIHEDHQKSMEAINKTLSLDENLSEAHSTLCEEKMYYEYDFAGAEASCKRAVELNPDSSQAHQIYSRYLFSRGRFDEAIAEIKTAIDLEPALLFNHTLYGINFYYARRYPEAVVQFKRVMAMEENFGIAHFWLILTLVAQGNEPEAFEWVMNGVDFDKADEATIQVYKRAYQTSGWRGVMQERAKRFEQSDEIYFRGAEFNAQAGNKDKAFEYLEKSYQRREMWMAYLQVDPRLDALRDDPRFAELVRRVEKRIP
ncbi:MAG: tetratricopeptide repeat protein, partial [Acidobacteria bacterium]|nr:tetratricopeptide repeat protein [Acidobacteriota bacterium]